MLSSHPGQSHRRNIGPRGLCVLLLAVNLAVWVWAFLAFDANPLLLGTALLAYTLGLRHAVDADHIAAIDNVTRRLVQEGKRPATIGFHFALGHATLVVLIALAAAFAADRLDRSLPEMREFGGLIGTAISSLFLFSIAAANTIILRQMWRSFRALRRGEPVADLEIDALLARRGLLGRLSGPFLRLIGESWHMYPLGFLFGLGFDTASEVALLGIAAGEAARGLSPLAVLVFPALFTAAMSLVDTADGLLMLGAYGWAFVKPLRRLYYNLTITVASVAVAVAVGSIEALGLVGQHLGLAGRFWVWVGAIDGNLAGLGALSIGVFLACWAVSAVVYRVRGFDEAPVQEG